MLISSIYASYSVFLTNGNDHVLIGSSIENKYKWYPSKYKTKHEWYHSGYLYTIAQDDKNCMTLEMGAKRDKTQGPARNEIKQNSAQGIECKRVNPQNHDSSTSSGIGTTLRSGWTLAPMSILSLIIRRASSSLTFMSSLTMSTASSGTRTDCV